MSIKTPKDNMTERIYFFLQKIDTDVMKFKSPRISQLYLWRPNMWNAALVEGTGWVIYSTILFLVYGSLWLSILLPMPLSFFTKYLIYNRWLFKKDLNKIVATNNKHSLRMPKIAVMISKHTEKDSLNEVGQNE